VLDNSSVFVRFYCRKLGDHLQVGQCHRTAPSVYSVVNSGITERDEALKRKNRVFIALVVISNAVGNLLLGEGMKQMPSFQNTSVFGYLVSLFGNFWILAGIALLIVWMVSQLTMYTWADLSYVLPVTASGYILTAILSKFFLGDIVSFARWAGIVLISFGVVFVADTPPREKPIEGEDA
jgi:uncharacterized membrane protein